MNSDKREIRYKFNHLVDCSIYASDCDICDCGEFRGMMPDIDRLNNENVKLLVKHQCQIREFTGKEHRSLSSYLRTLFLKFIGNR